MVSDYRRLSSFIDFPTTRNERTNDVDPQKASRRDSIYRFLDF